ncbi:hypothetical protein Tcan_00811, partial [Toxocara canis]
MPTFSNLLKAMDDGTRSHIHEHPLCPSEVASEDACKRTFELLIGHRIAKRIDCTVHIAEEVANRVNQIERLRLLTRLTESHHCCQHVKRRPQDRECTQYKRYRSKCLKGKLIWREKKGKERSNISKKISHNSQNDENVPKYFQNCQKCARILPEMQKCARILSDRTICS